MKPSRDIGTLIEIMAALRTPTTGCPWDLEQTFATIAPYTIEEAYEVADAIARADLEDLRDELGDLLLQVVFHARMAAEQGAFDFGDVVQAITEKLVRRHPHVFGDAAKLSPDEVRGLWERIKAAEKTERASRRPSRDGGGRIRQGALAAVAARAPGPRPGLWSCKARPPGSASIGANPDRSWRKSARRPTKSPPPPRRRTASRSPMRSAT